MAVGINLEASMNGRAPLLMLVLAANLTGISSFAQGIVQTPSPTVTADDERWYLNGEPITFAGTLYYPAGAQIYFNANEMVRSGFYMGIPLYTRTTLEPYSIVFVPLDGGRLQPYERPRTGELTGTAGSTPALLPSPAETVPPGGLAPQAAGPPSATTQMQLMQMPRPQVAPPQAGSPQLATASEPSPTVGTTGAPPIRPLHTQIGGRPQGSNSIFIEYAGDRWYPLGGPRPIDTGRLVRLDDFKGFEVWGNADTPTTLLIPITRGSSLGVLYTRVRPARD
jgi:hypothetical protein